VLPGLQARAEGGAADHQLLRWLINECALQPADLAAAREWYRKAETASDWKDRQAKKRAPSANGAREIRRPECDS
jgi:hypothetical protein